MFQAQGIIGPTLAGSDMEKTGAGGVIHEAVPSEKAAGALGERMLILQIAKLGGIEAADDFIALPFALGRHGGQQQSGDNELLLAHADEGVVESGVVGDRQVGGERPGSGGPDDYGGPGPIDDGKFYVNTLADVFFVLHFSLG